jgi:hypothetical protein
MGRKGRFNSTTQFCIEQLRDMEAYVKELKEHRQKLKKGQKGLSNPSEKENQAKLIKRKYPSTEEATSKEIKRMETKIQSEFLKLENKVYPLQ